MMKIIKRLLILLVSEFVFFLTFGWLTAIAASKIIPLHTRVDSDFQVGFLADLVWLFFIGGFVGLIPGFLVAVKIWQRIK